VAAEIQVMHMHIIGLDFHVETFIKKENKFKVFMENHNQRYEELEEKVGMLQERIIKLENEG
jgi:uncharacterized protein YydD (DUF2326 family)